MIKTPLSTVIGGVGMYTKNSLIIGDISKTEPPFDTASLFENGKQGFWLDPNDLSTMFQDSAGTIPVTSADQPVGLMLDKSKGLVMGSELIITLDLTTWATVNSPEVTKNTFTTAATGGVRLDGVLQNGTWYKCIVELDSTVGVQLYGGQQVVTLPGTGRRTITLYYEASAAGFYFRNSGAGTTTIHSLSIESIAGNHAYQTTSASRPTLRKNAVTGANYLEFDGSDDFLVTNSIDFTATDEITVITAVKNTSTKGYQNIVEFSGNSSINDGTFLLRCPHEFNPFYLSKGTAAAQLALITTLNLLDGVVLSAKSKISTDNLTLSVNGVSGVINTDQGTGNYGNHPLYIGRRGGLIHPFNGHIYGLIGVGKLVSEDETEAIEKELAKRLGVTI